MRRPFFQNSQSTNSQHRPVSSTVQIQSWFCLTCPGLNNPFRPKRESIYLTLWRPKRLAYHCSTHSAVAVLTSAAFGNTLSYRLNCLIPGWTAEWLPLEAEFGLTFFFSGLDPSPAFCCFSSSFLSFFNIFTHLSGTYISRFIRFVLSQIHCGSKPQGDPSSFFNLVWLKPLQSRATRSQTNKIPDWLKFSPSHRSYRYVSWSLRWALNIHDVPSRSMFFEINAISLKPRDPRKAA